tara:strand:- start:1894 stop:2415 length:522 start_codon:yes stop_codon:yes gene_type:complete
LKTTTDIQEASYWIKEGKVIAYPTEGIWGLGGLNTSDVIKALDIIKKRPKNKKYILLFSSHDQLFKKYSFTDEIKNTVINTPETFVTMLLPIGGKEKIAARIPNNKLLLNFLELIGEEIISTSANISGKPVCATAKEIKYTFNETIYGVLDLPLGGEKGPSRILDVETNEYRR